MTNIIIAVCGGSAILIIFGALIINAIVQNKKRSHLLAVSETAMATILEMENKGGVDETLLECHFLLEVSPPNRSAYRARTSATIRIENIPRFQPGSVVQVKYNPNDPTQVMML